MIKNILYLSSFLCLATACQEVAEDLPPPNILWITCEDISPNIGAYGDVYAHTPHIDQLAAAGIRYTNAFASAPVCAVARSGIITGMYASSQGTQYMRCDGRLPEGIQTYPDYLRAAGYYCTNNSKTDYNLDIDHKALWDESSNKAHWRNRPKAEQPFFAIFNFTTSHESRVNEEDNYKKAISDLPPSLLKKPGEVPLPPYYPDTDIVRELWARYYNIITAMDQQVGEIMQQLEEDGLTENTIVIFYSDHGAGIPRHKRWLYDAGLSVPFIVKAPEKYAHLLPHPQGQPTDELVSFIDLAPTALHLANIPVPVHMQGRAFLGKNLSPERNYIHAGRDRMDERYDMQRAVRNKDYKYIRYYEPYKPYCQYMNTPEQGGIMQAIRAAAAAGTLPAAGLHIVAPSKPKEALYDLKKDPDELHNLAEDPAYAATLEELRAAHAQWSDDTKDTGLIPETILRKWEADANKAIYHIMREQAVPVSEIRQTAIGDLSIADWTSRLGHNNEAVRYWAAIQLGNQAQNITDTSPLQQCLTDSIPIVRLAAARALCLIGKVQMGLDCLQQELFHSDEWVRLASAQVLDELGEQARPALSALQGVMADQNKYVVRVANHAINGLMGTEVVVP